MKKILLVFGTRPEAIKMCPLVRELDRRPGLVPVVCASGQHREMLVPMLAAFGVEPGYDLRIMRRGQTPLDITAAVMEGLRPVLEREAPDIVLVQGDTTTAFAAALTCFYMRVPVGHVEAGLRTYDVSDPYPEEFSRQAVGIIARYHFAPTAQARANLLREGKRAEDIFVTGNTAIDALRFTVREDFAHPILDWAAGSRLCLLTAHRRESFGEPMRRMLRAVRGVVEEQPDVKVLYPVHRNPAVMRAAEEELRGCDRIRLTEPLGVTDFHNIMARSCLILTDSGGIQEEATALGRPVLVMRERTERPEGVEAGTLRLVGTQEADIRRSFTELLTDRAAYDAMARAAAAYGDGHACERIADILERA